MKFILILFLQISGDRLSTIHDQFIADAMKFGHKIEERAVLMYCDTLKGDTIGVSHWIEDHWLVLINANQTEPWPLETTVYHELGHAYLGRDHCKGKSIMNYKYLFLDITDSRNQYFITELMSQSKPRKGLFHKISQTIYYHKKRKHEFTRNRNRRRSTARHRP